MAIKYLPIDSTGVGFDVGEERTVDVTNEALDLSGGFPGDVVTYTAIVKDNVGEAMPITFCAELRGDGFELASITFQPSVYDPITYELTIPFFVVGSPGSYTINLTSVVQII